MSADQKRSGFLGYDVFKLVVALVLLIILILLLLRGCSGAGGLAAATEAVTATQTATSSPTASAPTASTAVAPVIVSPRDGETVEGLVVKLQGTGQPEALLLVNLSGKDVASVTVDKGGNWTTALPVDEGQHVFVVHTEDGALKSNQVSITAVPLVVTALAPPSGPVPTSNGVAPEIISPRDGEQVTGPLRLQGRGQPGTQLRVSDSGKDIGSVNVDKGGNWVFDTQIYTGQHDFVVRTADGALKSNQVSVTVVPPVATLISKPSPTSPPTPAPTNIASGGGGCSPSGIPPNGYLKDKQHYVVGSCDTLSGIAVWLKVTVDSLLASNPQITDPDKIVPGEVLTVPPS